MRGMSRFGKILEDSYFINNGVENIMEKTKRVIKYKMPYALAMEITNNQKKNEWQKVLCEYVNTQYNLIGECVEVILY